MGFLGAPGDNNYVGSSKDDLIKGGGGNDTLWGRGGNDHIEGEEGADYLAGEAGNDLLLGGVGNDYLLGGGGIDMVYGGDGDDDIGIYNNGFALAPGDARPGEVYDGGAGWDEIDLRNADISAVTLISIEELNASRGALTLDQFNQFQRYDGDVRLTTGGTIAFNGRTVVSGSILYLSDANTTVDLRGIVMETSTFEQHTLTISAGDGDDVLYAADRIGNSMGGGGGEDRIFGSRFSDYIGGGSGDDVLEGYDNGDRLEGGAGNDILKGGTGDDIMIGGTGDDIYYVDSADDQVQEMAGQGYDEVVTSLFRYNMRIHVEKLTYTGTGSFQGRGNISDNLIDASAGSGPHLLDGHDGNDVLIGGIGADQLTGGKGADRMVGGKGDDRYIVDNSADVIVELAGQGYDSVEASASFSIAEAAVEMLTLTGNKSIDATGNDLSNRLYGNAGNNRIDARGGNDELRGYGGNDILNGGAGNDRLYGGVGDDIYEDVEAGDLVSELANEGSDTVTTRMARYTLGNNLENLTYIGTGAFRGIGDGGSNRITAGGSGNHILEGGAGDDLLTGGDGNDTQYGGSGNDRLFGGAGEDHLGGSDGDDYIDGGAGADRMQGGVGDDVYVVDNVGDRISELNNAGIDRVEASVSYTLDVAVEHMTLTGSAAISATGNALANELTGNSGANVLDGKGGADVMAGGLGNDTYYVDDAGDVVRERDGEGTDLVYSAISYTLGNHVEWLWLTGSAAINATGNDRDNRLFGNEGNNVLDGKYGDDAMWGGRGDDTYYVDSSSDVVNESANAGTDTVYVGFDYVLAANVERLVLTGWAVNGTGNALNNEIIGTDAYNVLDGGAGADVMSGGGGGDVYIVDNVGDVVIETAEPIVDTVYASVSFTLGANVESLLLTGSASINGTGNAQENVIYGNEGANTLNGGGGSDLLGGLLGMDVLTGGAGADLFYFDAMGAANADRITDFSRDEDLIVLNSSVFEGVYDFTDDEGVLISEAFRTGSRASDANDRIIYNSGTGELFYDADGTGAIAQQLFARVASGLSLSAGDFVVY